MYFTKDTQASIEKYQNTDAAETALKEHLQGKSKQRQGI